MAHSYLAASCSTVLAVCHIASSFGCRLAWIEEHSWRDGVGVIADSRFGQAAVWIGRFLGVAPERSRSERLARCCLGLTTAHRRSVVEGAGYRGVDGWHRPSLDYLRDLGAFDAAAAPLHVGGISSTHVGLVYLDLEYQRSYASNTLRGAGDDARAVIAPLVAWIRDAPGAVGLG